MRATQLIGISLTVADLTGSAAFYRDCLGLEVGREQTLGDAASNSMLGLARGTTARAVDVAIGQQWVELVAFDPPGRPYPSERASNDQWFQHFSLVCGDIAAVWERLKRGPMGGDITEGAPVLLPPNTGGVTAFKFRDPEAHPLELIFFPKGVGATVWQEMSGKGIRGYDHTAISVMDLDRSIAFYADLLGFRIGGRSLNQGPEQDRLDDLTGCEVDVVALHPASVAAPHLELLHYRTPRGRAQTSLVAANDVASARQVYGIDNLNALVRRLKAENVTFVSPGEETLKDGGKAAAIRDPDGHMIVLMERRVAQLTTEACAAGHAEHSRAL